MRSGQTGIGCIFSSGAATVAPVAEATELDGKRQEILIEAVPGLRRMAALAHADSTPIAKLDTLQEAARARNIELSIHRIARAEEIPAAIDMAKASSAEALNVLASAVLYVNRQLIMDRAAALRLPAIYQRAENAEEGGFLAYGPRILSIIPEFTSRQLVKLSSSGASSGTFSAG